MRWNRARYYLWQGFQRMMEEELKVVAAKEDEEADEEAGDKEDREAFEQR